MARRISGVAGSVIDLFAQPQLNHHTRIEGGLMAQASAYGLVLVTVILVPIVVATLVFRIDLFSSRA